MRNIQHIILILITVVILILPGCTQDRTQLEWKQVNSGTDKHLYGVNFIDGKLGWAAGSNGFVFSSKDGGNTWMETGQIAQLSDTLTQVSFTTHKNGWVVSIGKVHYTGSGGNSWVVQHHERSSVGKSPGILDIHFVTKSEGWVVGGFGTVLHTQNGGGKWEKINTSSEKHLWGVYFADPKHGWIVGEDSEILHTQDGGKQWIRQETDAEQPLFAVYFVDLMKGWIVGTNGLILNTEDGGQTWNRQKNSFKGSLRDVAFSNETEGWVIGEEGAILHTTDGGITWVRIASPTAYNLQDIHLNKKSGWIVGEKGTILKLN